MSNTALARLERLDALRAEVRALSPETRTDVDRISFEAMDARLAGGGIVSGVLHEMTGATQSVADDAAATLFAAGIAARAGAGVVLWVMSKPDLFAPGLSQAGLPPSRLIQVNARCDEDARAVIEDGLRHGGLAAVVGEIAWVSVMATRRLQLAAEEGRTTALLLRRWRRASRIRCPTHPRRSRAGASAARLPLRFRFGKSGGRAGTSPWFAREAGIRAAGCWRHAMRRVVSPHLPSLSTDRLRRPEAASGPRPDRRQASASSHVEPIVDDEDRRRGAWAPGSPAPLSAAQDEDRDERLGLGVGAMRLVMVRICLQHVPRRR